MKTLQWLLIFSVSLGALRQSVAAEFDCQAFGRQLVEESYRETNLDPVALQRWIEAQPSKQYRKYAQMISDQLKIISRTEFEQYLLKAMEPALKSIDPKDEVIIVYSEENESARWTGHYAQALNEKLRLTPTMNFQKAAERSVLAQAEGKKVHWLAFDDGAYSGHQMREEASEAAMALAPLRKKNLPSVQAHFIRAFGSARSLKVTKKLVEGHPIDFSYGLTRDAFDVNLKIPKKEEAAFNEFLNYLEIDTEPVMDTLTIPFHKVPDSVSFPSGLLIGVVPGTQDRIRFIDGPVPGRDEPYRQPAYLQTYPAEGR